MIRTEEMSKLLKKWERNGRKKVFNDGIRRGKMMSKNWGKKGRNGGS